MDSDNQPILELLVNTTMEIYNSGGFSRWSTDYKTYEPFFDLVYPRIKAENPNMLNGESTIREITRDFHGFVTRYLNWFVKNHRCSGIDKKYWRKDILRGKEFNEKFPRHLDRLEVELSKLN